VRQLKFVINRRGCRGKLDRRTALALEKMAEAAWKEQAKRMASLDTTLARLVAKQKKESK
jgi:hypothetical protein